MLRGRELCIGISSKVERVVFGAVAPSSVGVTLKGKSETITSAISRRNGIPSRMVQSLCTHRAWLPNGWCKAHAPMVQRPRAEKDAGRRENSDAVVPTHLRLKNNM